jgi:hypothetical protein
MSVYLETNMSLLDFPNEIIDEIFAQLPIKTIYTTIIILNKLSYNIVNEPTFIKAILKINYPKFSHLILSSTSKENLKKIYKCIDTKIRPRNLPYKINNIQYLDKTLVLPYNIIATILDLPKLEMMYTEIIGYLRCASFSFDKVKDFPEKPDIFRITIFVIVKDKSIFENYTGREKLDMTFEELFKNITPINIKDTEHFKQNSNDMYAITIQTFEDNTKKLFFSGLNSDRDLVKKLFEEVKADYKSKYS